MINYLKTYLIKNIQVYDICLTHTHNLKQNTTILHREKKHNMVEVLNSQRLPFPQ